jgi:hypothetical protein
VACVSQARHRVIFGKRIRSVGKQARDESGKYPVNEKDEEIFARVRRALLWLQRVPIHSSVLNYFGTIASEAKQSIVLRKRFAFVAGNDGSHRRAKRKCPEPGPGIASILSIEARLGLARNRLAERGLRRGKPRDRHAVG